MPPTALLFLSLTATEPPAEFLIGGCGGAYFLAPRGPLEIRLVKHDRNRSLAPAELRAILFGPDRQVLGEVRIPDGGGEANQLGPAQSATLKTEVERPGVYGLNVTVSNDRYGDNIAWGFSTNCPRWVIETARGHRDRRHEEPLLLLDGARPGQVCFRPRPGAFNIALSGVTPRGEVVLRDSAERPVATLMAGADGKATCAVPADPARGIGPWRLTFPQAGATVEIDGLTRWERDDPLPDQAVWSPDSRTWFNWHDNRWLLTPYRQATYGRPGQPFELPFKVHNNAAAERTIALELEFPDTAWEVAASAREVVVPARGTAQVLLRGRYPADAAAVHLRATPAGQQEFTTYATLQTRPGEGPTAKPFEPPLELRPYDHENAVLGYRPAAPLDNQPYFDGDGRAFVRTAAGLASRLDGGWSAVALNEATVERIPAFTEPITGLVSTKVAFDADNDVYLLASAGRQQLLMHSQDHGRTFRAYVIPGRQDRARGLDFEQFSGNNVPAGPPPIVRNTQVPTEPDPKLFWRRVNELDLFVPRKVDGRLELGAPIRISDVSLGLSGHSGMPSAVVSRGEKVHVIWGEATPPEEKVPGVPTRVASYDRATGRLGQPALIGYGPPANDIHNTPSLTIDAEGYLYALTGTHGQPFHYARSLVANEAGSGWTPPEPTGQNLAQTYVGLVCGPDGTLHLVYRLGHRGQEPFALANHSTLTYQRKRPGQAWEAPRHLVVPAFSEYCVYYHRLTIDHAGTLYLSYDYWSTHWFYRNDQRERVRTVLSSSDGGDSWRLW